MVIAVDVGTSSARASAYAVDGRAVSALYHQVPYEPRVTADGGVEHDPGVLLAAVATCLDAVCARAGRAAVRAVGVTTFWHGLCGFDAAGQAVTPVYTWADSRSARDAGLLRDALDEAGLHARTGCHLHSSYWPAKLRWFARERAAEARRVTRWGSFGEHLELTLFGEAATSVSMASATGLFDVAAGTWDAEALAAAGVETRHLFRVVDRAEGRRGLRREWAARWPALHAVPWFPAVGDGAAGNVGSDCLGPDRIALNVGTSAALRVATGRAQPPPPGLWRYGIDRERLLLGGATSEGGNVYAWCREVLRLPDDATLEQRLEAMTPDAHGLTVLPFLAGERAPGWRGDRRGAVAGLSLDTGALAGNAEDAVGRDRHPREQRRVCHAVVGIRVIRRHAPLVPEEEDGAVPRHLRGERRLREPLVRRARRGAARQGHREAPARGDGGARDLEHLLRRGLRERARIVDDTDLGGRGHGHDHTLSSNARCRASASRYRAWCAGSGSKVSPSGARAAARSGRAPSACSASRAAPRLVVSGSCDHVTG